MPIATVGIPFFNEEQALAPAIRSILRQEMADIDVLLVDDGSQDRSLEIARSFDDARVTVVSDGKHLGLPARLNEIARLARTELVARMDADDVSHPLRLARQLALLERTSSDAVGAWAALIDEHDEPFGIIEAPSRTRTPAEILELGVFPHATMLARRDWLLSNPYDEALTRAEDRELFCRTAPTARFDVVPEVLYVVRINARGTDFLSDYRASHAQNRIIFRRYGPELVGRGRTGIKLAASHAKTLIMTAAVKMGRAGRIVRRRGRPARPEEILMVREALDAAR